MKEEIKISKYDVAEHLRTPQEMAAYLEACFDEFEGDETMIIKALGDIARAKAMTQLAYETKVSKEILDNTLSEKEVSNFMTILKIIKALGIKLRLEATNT
jgi:probable addiction module antidote protein